MKQLVYKFEKPNGNHCPWMGFSGLGYCQLQGLGTWLGDLTGSGCPLSHLVGSLGGGCTDERPPGICICSSASFPECWLYPWDGSPHGHKMVAKLLTSFPDTATCRERTGTLSQECFLVSKCQAEPHPQTPQQTFFPISLLVVRLCTQVPPNAEREMTVIGIISQGPPVSLEMGLAPDKNGELGLYQEERGKGQNWMSGRQSTGRWFTIGPWASC